MHARLTFEGDHNQVVAIARKAVAAACVSLAALGYKPGGRHPVQRLWCDGALDPTVSASNAETLDRGFILIALNYSALSVNVSS
jgi:hypothetical protein